MKDVDPTGEGYLRAINTEAPWICGRVDVECCGKGQKETEKKGSGNRRVDVDSGDEDVRWIVELGRIAEEGENAGGQGLFLDGQIVVSANNVSGRNCRKRREGVCWNDRAQACSVLRLG